MSDVFDQRYQEYLKSSRWRELRKKALEYYGHECMECKRTDGVMQVHHITYENMGNESLEDVIILCKSCHYKEHFTGIRHKYKKPDCWHDNIEPMIFRSGEKYYGVWYCLDCRQIAGCAGRILTPKEKRYIEKDIAGRNKLKRKNLDGREFIQVITFDKLPQKYKKEIPDYCRCKGKMI